MTRDRFTRLVEEALRTIPRRFRGAMHNVAVIVEDEPSAQVRSDLGLDEDETLLGLYEGTPLPERGATFGNALPDRISIFQQPIEEECEDEGDEESPARDEAIRVCVAETVIHEFGHYFGLTEDEIQEIEEAWWSREE
jgi:predicted Zn-dependent protease with MMP-like domain